jgi:hypothetical protein
MSELLPCPFCGSTSISEWAGYGTQADIVCDDCGCERAIQVRDAPGCKESEWDDKSYRFDDPTVARVNEYLRREWNERSHDVAPSVQEPVAPTGRVHRLKTWPRYFNEVLSGRKSFEWRLDDRNYVAGDVLVLQEWEPERENIACKEGRYTGREITKTVSFVFSPFPVAGRTVVMSLADAADPQRTAMTKSAEPDACGPLVCKAAKDDGVICADDECDRVNGVRPASSVATPPSDAAREALREITEACEADCGVPAADDEDDEAVGASANGPMALTFGMLRRARAALAPPRNDGQSGGARS